MHVRELHFLEVGVDPYIVQRHDGEQTACRRDALADLDAAFGDDATRPAPRAWCGRTASAALRTAGRGRQHLRMVIDARALCLRDGLRQLLARRGDRGAHREVTLSRACESSSPEIAPSSSRPWRRCRSDSAVRSADSRCSICARQLRTFVRTARVPAARCGPVRPRRWPSPPRHRPDRARAAVSRPPRLGVIDVHRQHGAGLLAADLHHIAVDVGVIGGFEVARVAEPIEPVTERRRARPRRRAAAGPVVCRCGAHSSLGALGWGDGVCGLGVFMGRLVRPVPSGYWNPDRSCRRAPAAG
jgi:hypothetical protein